MTVLGQCKKKKSITFTASHPPNTNYQLQLHDMSKQLWWSPRHVACIRRHPSHGAVVDVDGTVVSSWDDLWAGAVVLYTPHLNTTRTERMGSEFELHSKPVSTFQEKKKTFHIRLKTIIKTSGMTDIQSLFLSRTIKN